MARDQLADLEPLGRVVGALAREAVGVDEWQGGGGGWAEEGFVAGVEADEGGEEGECAGGEVHNVVREGAGRGGRGRLGRVGASGS